MIQKENKKVLFVTTKNIDYIRNVQEIKLLNEKYKEVKIIYSKSKNYYIRILVVNFKLFFLNKKKFDIIFIGFLPQLIIPFLYKKRKQKQIIIIDFFISIYDTLVNDRKKVKQNTIMSKILKKIDKNTLKKVDEIIVDTKESGKYYIEELDADNNKIKVLYIEANEKIYAPSKVNQIEKENKDDFIVLFFGTGLPLQGVDIVLKSAELLKNNSKIKFIIIGNIKTKKDYTNIKFLPFMNEEELARYIKMADLCLVGHFNNQIEKAKRTIPCKAFICKAMNKKMILGKNKANMELFNDKDENIYYVEMGNSQELSKIISNINKENLQKY